MVELVNYSLISRRYEEIANIETEELKRVGWKNTERAQERYKYFLSEIKKSIDSSKSSKFTVFDIGCGLCLFYKYIINNDDEIMRRMKYCGIDTSYTLIQEVKKNNKNINVIRHDFIEQSSEQSALGKCDFAVINGIFTQKFELSQQEMIHFFKKFLLSVIPVTKIMLNLNVMSDNVDYRLPGAFHLSEKEIDGILKDIGIDNYKIDTVVPYEYNIKIYVQ